MATSTFDKEIVIDNKAADIIINVLNKPAPKRFNDNEALKRRIAVNKINREQLLKIIDDIFEEIKDSAEESPDTYSLGILSAVITRDILIGVLKHFDLYEE